MGCNTSSEAKSNKEEKASQENQANTAAGNFYIIIKINNYY